MERQNETNRYLQSEATQLNLMAVELYSKISSTLEVDG